MKKLLITILCLFPTYGHSKSPEVIKGYEIAVETDRRETGYQDAIADMLMILSNRNGDESRREIKFRSLEMDEDGDKSLTIFKTPRDVKGTAFLSFTHALKADDQWIYLPALKRVKRIASKNKSGPFMGSEFAYEDLTSPELDKYNYKLLGNDVIDEQNCFVVEFYPRYEHSGYTRQVVWTDEKEYIPRKIEYFDRKNTLLKTLTYINYRQYQDRYWRADKMLMVNHQTGKSTQLLWSNYSFRNGLTDRDFDRNTLKRAR